MRMNNAEYRYLDKVTFRTPAGRQMANERRAYTKGFLKQLRQELAAIDGQTRAGTDEA